MARMSHVCRSCGSPREAVLYRPFKGEDVCETCARMLDRAAPREFMRRHRTTRGMNRLQAIEMARELGIDLGV